MNCTGQAQAPRARVAGPACLPIINTAVSSVTMSVKSPKSKKKRSRPAFNVYIQLPVLGITPLCLEGITGRTKIKTIKNRLDKDAGLLPEMYHLSYLDAAPLDDDSTLSSHDVIPGATLTLRPWRSWADLLTAAYLGDTDECFACSVNIDGGSAWSKYCAWAALYVASHRGHHVLVAKLLERTSLSINTTTSCGRTALHASARAGNWKVLCILLDNGADVRIKDSDNLTAFDLSRKYGHKKCEHSLNFCQWNLQKHHIVQERKLDYDASNARRKAERESHQYADSTHAPGLRGTQGQIYVFHTPNPVSVGHVKEFKKGEDERLPKKPPEVIVSKSGEGGELEFNYGWFDPLRAQQLIPSTHDVLTYSDPSSCHLRPKSLLNPGGYVSSPKAKKKLSTPGGRRGRGS